MVKKQSWHNLAFWTLIAILIVLFIFLIIMRDPVTILFGIILGVAVFLLILAASLEKFFPKNKVSKSLEKIAEWIRDNVNLNI